MLKPRLRSIKVKRPKALGGTMHMEGAAQTALSAGVPVIVSICHSRPVERMFA